MISENLIALIFCNEISLFTMPSGDQLISFQLTNHRQTLLKLHLLRKTNIDLLSNYLKNLIDSYIIYLHPIKRHWFGQKLRFQ